MHEWPCVKRHEMPTISPKVGVTGNRIRHLPLKLILRAWSTRTHLGFLHPGQNPPLPLNCKTYVIPAHQQASSQPARSSDQGYSRDCQTSQPPRLSPAGNQQAGKGCSSPASTQILPAESGHAQSRRWSRRHGYTRGPEHPRLGEAWTCRHPTRLLS